MSSNAFSEARRTFLQLIQSPHWDKRIELKPSASARALAYQIWPAPGTGLSIPGFLITRVIYLLENLTWLNEPLEEDTRKCSQLKDEKDGFGSPYLIGNGLEWAADPYHTYDRLRHLSRLLRPPHHQRPSVPMPHCVHQYTSSSAAGLADTPFCRPSSGVKS